MVPVRARSAGVCRAAARAALCFVSTAIALAGAAVADPPVEQQPMVLAALPTTHAKESPSAALRTRFVFFLDRKVDFHVLSLQNPNRVVIDLPDVKVQLPVIPGDKPVGLVRSVRGGLAAPGKMRVEINVTEPVIVETAQIEPAKEGRSPRFVLQLTPVEGSKSARKSIPGAAHAGLGMVQPPLPRAAVRPEARAARAFKPVIVLDPGHGGHDSGAMRYGTVEKEVVLAFSHVLRDKLKATGRYKVLMTRDTDTFIPLSDRREFAEQNNAALFIAIHADYAGSQARGATIYSLRDNVAAELRRSAKGEVAQEVLSDSEIRALKQNSATDLGAVKGILADLAQREVQVTKDRTSLFARSVIEYMGTSTNMMSNPDRSAAFAVLRTAKVPAVLIELAYVSNKQDAAQLKSDEWRQKVSATILTAIDNYFSHQLARLPPS